MTNLLHRIRETLSVSGKLVQSTGSYFILFFIPLTEHKNMVGWYQMLGIN